MQCFWIMYSVCWTTAVLNSQITVTKSGTCHSTKISRGIGSECHRFKGPASNWNPIENTRKYQVTINNKVTGSNKSPTVPVVMISLPNSQGDSRLNRGSLMIVRVDDPLSSTSLTTQQGVGRKHRQSNLV